MISSRISTVIRVIGAIAALVMAAVAVIESDTIRDVINSERYKKFMDVSNGDVLSIIQLVLLFFVYLEVRRVQQALMGRGSSMKDK